MTKLTTYKTSTVMAKTAGSEVNNYATKDLDIQRLTALNTITNAAIVEVSLT